MYSTRPTRIRFLSKLGFDLLEEKLGHIFISEMITKKGGILRILTMQTEATRLYFLRSFSLHTEPFLLRSASPSFCPPNNTCLSTLCSGILIRCPNHLAGSAFIFLVIFHIFCLCIMVFPFIVWNVV